MKKGEREGPIPRKITFFGSVPVMMKPPTKTLSPFPTRKRVEIFARTPGIGLGEAVTVGDTVAEGVTVTVAVGVGGRVSVGVAVAVAVAVTVAVGVQLPGQGSLGVGNAVAGR